MKELSTYINTKLLYGFTGISLIISVVFIYLSPFDSIAGIILLPAIGAIMVVTNWRDILTAGYSILLLKFIVIFLKLEGAITAEQLLYFAFDFFIYSIVILTIGFFRINRHKQIQELKDLILLDPLTQIYNRRYFDMYMEELFNKPTIDDEPLLIILDIDHFKQVNDTYGHPVGDRVLKNVSKVIKSKIRDTDRLMRIGGEEFAILLPRTTLDEGARVAERVRHAVEKSWTLTKKDRLFCTISLGLTQYNDGDTRERFINRADDALYHAKQSGRNRVIIR